MQKYQASKIPKPKLSTVFSLAQFYLSVVEGCFFEGEGSKCIRVAVVTPPSTEWKKVTVN